MRVSTFLMFQNFKAKEAMTFYASVFPSFEIEAIEHHDADDKESGLKTARAQLNGHQLTLSDSPIQHAFDFTPSVSIFIDFEEPNAQQTAFDTLSEGGDVKMPMDNYGFSHRFGWVSDRFGVSWQLNLPAD